MRLSLAALLLLASASVAHADTFQSYTITGTLVNGSVGGTVTLDETTGNFTADSNIFVITTGSQAGSYTFNQTSNIITTQNFSGFSYLQEQNGQQTAYIEIPVLSLINYTGGSLCTTASTCSGHSSTLLGISDFTSGSLTPLVATAATPEPSSLALLGTGLLGVVGVARRRFVNA